jgi:hypothetical protein
MISQIKQQDIDLWEAWVEYDQLDPHYFGTLYVNGEVVTGQTGKCPLIIKKQSQSGAVLTLELPHMLPGRNYTREVCYSEPICSLEQYAAIHIYAGTEFITCIDEIEILI